MGRWVGPASAGALRAVAAAALASFVGAAAAAEGEPPPLFAAPAGQAAPPRVLRSSPAPGDRVADDRPAIEISLSGPVAPGDLSMALDRADVTGGLVAGPSGVTYRPPAPLAVGEHTVRLFVGGAPATSITFAVAPAAGGGTGDGAGGRADWTASAVSTTTAAGGTGAGGAVASQARLQLDSSGDLRRGAFFLRQSTSLAMVQGIRPGTPFGFESRNYVVAGGVRGDRFGAEAQAGYFVPAFLDGSELLTTGAALGGVAVKVVTPALTASAWQSYDSRPGGVLAGAVGVSQTVRAAAIEAPLDPERFSLRAIAIAADDAAGSTTAGGHGVAVGLLGRWVAGPAAALVLEAAEGGYDPAAGSPDPRRSGGAFRAGVTGAAGDWSYSSNLRATSQDYVDPANRGLGVGAGSDRTGGDLTLTRRLGDASVGAGYHHLQGGDSSGAEVASMREDGGNLFASVPAGLATLTAVGTATWQRNDADPTRALLASDQRSAGGTLSASEAAGRLQLVEGYAWQRVDDRAVGTSQTVQTGTLTAGGQLSDTVSLDALATATHATTAALPVQGDQLQLSLQPTFEVPASWLEFQPRAAWTAVAGTAVAPSSHAAQGQLLATWRPPWLRSLVTLQASVDWTHATGLPAFPGSIAPPADVVRIMGNLVLGWSGGSGRDVPGAPALAPVPGAIPGQGGILGGVTRAGAAPGPSFPPPSP